jgi:hypothetical protein
MIAVISELTLILLALASLSRRLSSSRVRRTVLKVVFLFVVAYLTFGTTMY